jgi:putative redox protein
MNSDQPTEMQMPEGVPVDHPIEVTWEGGMRYRGSRPGGPSLVVDGHHEAAPTPVDAMIIALASCSAIDVVDYLEKRRTPPSSLRVSVQFSRAPSPPRRITQARLTFHVAADSVLEHVERAAQLSFNRYCSVSNSLAPDTELSFEVRLTPAAEG